MISTIFNWLMSLMVITIIFLAIYSYVQWKFSYWKRKGIPYLKPKFPFGNVQNPISKSISLAEVLEINYKHFKNQGTKHAGMYSTITPIYLPTHPDSIKAIMTTHFNHFVDRGLYYNEKADPLSAHLFTMEGEKWKKMRSKLTPTFTSGKMKMMFNILVTCTDQLINAVDKIAKSGDAMDVKEILACFTTNVIASCAFGIECNSFEDKDSGFRKYGRIFFAPLSKYQTFKNLLVLVSPALGRFLGITTTSQDVKKFFLKAVKDTVEFREKTSFTRNDFMQILINLKNNLHLGENKEFERRLTIEEVAAQAFVFFAAGFETSSNTMTFCLFELAQNQEIQNKLRSEIIRTISNNDGRLTYEIVMEMKYLSQVIDETLRKYPPLPVIPRICVEDYKIPDTDATMEKGVYAFIPIFALHRDSEFFSNPEQFDPERFNEVNKSKIYPFAYIPFGEGPRACIGSRFGLMQTKIGITVLLKNFRFSLTKNTPLPLKFNAFSIVLLAKDKVYLNVEKLNQDFVH